MRPNVMRPNVKQFNVLDKNPPEKMSSNKMLSNSSARRLWMTSPFFSVEDPDQSFFVRLSSNLFADDQNVGRELRRQVRQNLRLRPDREGPGSDQRPDFLQAADRKHQGRRSQVRRLPQGAQSLFKDKDTSELSNKIALALAKSVVLYRQMILNCSILDVSTWLHH